MLGYNIMWPVLNNEIDNFCWAGDCNEKSLYISKQSQVYLMLNSSSN